MSLKSKLLYILAISVITFGGAYKASAIERTLVSQICAGGSPTLIAPIDGESTTASSVVARGKASANTNVTILLNNSAAAWVTSAADGSYTANIPLGIGDNHLKSTVVNNCGSTYMSNSATITRNIAPTPGPSPTPVPTPAPRPVIIPPAPADLPIQTPPADNPAQPETPIIEKPEDGSVTEDGKVPVSGTAKPFAVVEIIVNGEIIAKVVADETGKFEAQVPLKPGANKVQARVLAANEVKYISDLLTVTYEEKVPAVSAVRPINRWLETILVASSIIIIGGLATWLVLSKKKTKEEENVPPAPTIPPYSV